MNKFGTRQLLPVVLILSALAGGTCAAGSVLAEEAITDSRIEPRSGREQQTEIYDSAGLTGDWGGERSKLEENGVTLGLVYTGDAVKNYNGGLKKGSTYIGNVDLTLDVDTGKAGLWEGGTLHVYGLNDHGAGKPNTHGPTAKLAGDLQTLSNIDAENRTRLQEAWFQQSFSGDLVSVLAGLYDINSEFYVSNYGGLFTNSSFGIGPEITVNVPASIFPAAGLAARLKVQPVENWYLQVVGTDGDPSTRKVTTTEGYMAIVETGVTDGKNDGYKVGYWMHTANLTGQDGVSQYGSNYGAYAILDQTLFQIDDNQAISLFLQYGWSPAARSLVSSYNGAGLHFHGIVPTRTDDDFGIAFARAKISPIALNAAAPGTLESHETTIEATYRMVMTPWLAIQPSWQHIQNPGANPALSNANVGLLRFEASL